MQPRLLSSTSEPRPRPFDDPALAGATFASARAPARKTDPFDYGPPAAASALDTQDVVSAATSGWAGGIGGTVGGASYLYTTYTIGDPLPAGGNPIVINEYTALTIPGMWSGVRFLSETLAMIRREIVSAAITSGGSRRDKAVEHNHPWAYRLDLEPNDLQTAQQLFECWFHHAIIWGNGFLYIDWQERKLYNLPPDRTIPLRYNGQQYYALQIIYDYSRPTAQWRAVHGSEVLHLPGFGYDGMRGFPVIQLLNQSLRLGKSAEFFGEAFFRQGGHVGLVLETDRVLTKDQREDLKNQIDTQHTGLDAAHKALLLQAGIKAKSLSEPPETAQYNQTREFSILDVCRVLRVEPFVLYHYAHANYNSLEMMNKQVVDYSLMPWVTRASQEQSRKLLTPSEKLAGKRVRLRVDEIAQGDSNQQITAANQRMGSGLTNVNEERARMDLPPIGPAGDEFRIPVNQGSIQNLLRPPVSTTPAAGKEDQE